MFVCVYHRDKILGGVCAHTNATQSACRVALVRVCGVGLSVYTNTACVETHANTKWKMVCEHPRHSTRLTMLHRHWTARTHLCAYAHRAALCKPGGGAHRWRLPVPGLLCALVTPRAMGGARDVSGRMVFGTAFTGHRVHRPCMPVTLACPSILSDSRSARRPARRPLRIYWAPTNYRLHSQVPLALLCRAWDNGTFGRRRGPASLRQ
jgi:hypothetical protein